MAVKLRLARFGKTGKPAYRLVAIDEHKKRNGKAIEMLGSYNTLTNPAKAEFKMDRVKYWLSVGAQPSATVAAVLKKLNK